MLQMLAVSASCCLLNFLYQHQNMSAWFCLFCFPFLLSASFLCSSLLSFAFCVAASSCLFLLLLLACQDPEHPGRTLMTHAHAVVQEASQNTRGCTDCKAHQLCAEVRLVAEYAKKPDATV